MLRARLSFLMALALSLAAIAFVIFPDIFVRLAWTVLSGRSASERRIRVSTRITFWGAWLFDLICGLMHIEVEWPTLEAPIPDGPVIVISNHRSSLDPVVMLAVLRRLGQDNTNWIAKWQMLLAPFVNVMALGVGAIFVTRFMPGTDGRLIERGCERIRRDKAKICLFPEGTRFHPRKVRDGFRHVLRPRLRGFGILRKLLPEAPVLALNLCWENGATGDGQAVTIWGMASLYGKRLSVHAELAPAETIGRADDWLIGQFRRMDDALASSA
ncbi:MAG TPA: lysophospholipid acyltransferase family protein [Verrucomicrobiae bacterium]|nr:lysophospholipid acyltransferase family protein [Verrucomicrobiae bacterium]